MHSHEWLYAFVLELAELRVYVKVAVREDCIVVSFHEDEIQHAD
ncbi:MAG TPA: hypothetical protein VGL81_03230 [Polyangiaceae bacterium]